MSCTAGDWRRWLPVAVGTAPWQYVGDSEAWVQLGGGGLRLRWQDLPPRQLALVRLPQLRVCFAFEAVDETQRQAFMQRFDLYLQRGGG